MFYVVRIYRRCLFVAIAVLAGVLILNQAFFQTTATVSQPVEYPNLYVQTTTEFEPDVPKTVYLTYDDGPSKNTGALLDILKEEQVPATFFVVGKEDDTSLALYQRMVQEGHTLGVHTYSHLYREIYRSVEDYLADFNRIETLLYDTTGIHPQIFRFPGGSVNAIAPSKAVLSQIIGEMTERGYIYYDWNVVSGDDTATVYPAETLAQNVLEGSKNKDTVVVLFHDAPLCKTTPEATRMVIRALKEQGYRFDRLTPSVKPIQFAKPPQQNSTGR